MTSASSIEGVAFSPCCQRIIIQCFFQSAALRDASSNTRSKIGANLRGGEGNGREVLRPRHAPGPPNVPTAVNQASPIRPRDHQFSVLRLRMDCLAVRPGDWHYESRGQFFQSARTSGAKMETSVVNIPLRLARRRFALALVCAGLALSSAYATPSFAEDPSGPAPLAPQDGAAGRAPTPHGSTPYAPPDNRQGAEGEGNETGRSESPWGLPAPGCPYQEGPLDLIV